MVNPPQSLSHYGVPHEPAGFGSSLFQFISVWKCPAQLTKLYIGPSVGIKWKLLTCPSLIHLPYLATQDVLTGTSQLCLSPIDLPGPFLVD